MRPGENGQARSYCGEAILRLIGACIHKNCILRILPARPEDEPLQSLFASQENQV